MRRLILVALLLCALPVGAQVNYYPPSSGGETVTLVANTNVSIATTGTVEEVLATITVPANTFPNAYKGIIVRAIYQHAANTNGAIARIRIGGIGGTLVASTQCSTSNGYWMQEVVYRVFSATSLHGTNTAWPPASGNLTGIAPAEATGLTFTNPISVVINGLDLTAAGDTTLRQYSVSLIK